MGADYTEAQKRASAKYKASKVEITITADPAFRDRLRAFVEARKAKEPKISMNKIIIKAVTQYMDACDRRNKTQP